MILLISSFPADGLLTANCTNNLLIIEIYNSNKVYTKCFYKMAFKKSISCPLLLIRSLLLMSKIVILMIS